MTRSRAIRLTPLALPLLLAVLFASPAGAACSIQLSDQGALRMNSGEQKKITWNSVPGAGSYRVEDLIEGLGDPAAPDWTFGGAYTESHNGEAPNLTSYSIGHSVLYKMTFRLTVTALNRNDPAWVPCSASVQYVVAADAEMATVAARRIVPLAGKAPGSNGSRYSTALILAGTRPFDKSSPDDPKLFEGKIVFRPLNTRASDSDPSIPYALNGRETLVFDDVMAALGATGIGTIEIIPGVGRPAPQADAIIENILADGTRIGARVPAAWGRDQLLRSTTVTVGIRNASDTRLALGVRSYGDLGGFLILQHMDATGKELETVNASALGNTTQTIALASAFNQPLQPGDRITARYTGIEMDAIGGRMFSGGKGVVLFLTETGNMLNNPNVVYRESMDNPHYSDGFDPFLVY